MRDLTPLIIQSLTPTASDGALVLYTHVAVDIELNDSFDTVLRCATGVISIAAINILGTAIALGPLATHGDVRAYTAQLRATPDLIFSTGKNPNGLTITIENVSELLTPFVADENTLFDGAKITMSYCWLRSDGAYEADVVFVGKIQDTLELDENEVKLACVADTSAKDALVAGRSLTQRCIATFEDDRCRHTGAAPGSTCSKIKEDAVNGCRFWAWEAFFFGANFDTLSTTLIAPVSELIDPREISRFRNGGFPADGYPRPNRFFDPDYVRSVFL
jgi:hypothetical protein